MYSKMPVDKESLFKTIITENKTVDRYTFKTIAQISKTKQPILILIVYSQQMVIIYVHCNFEDWLHLQNCITPNASTLLNMNHNMCLQKKFNIQYTLVRPVLDKVDATVIYSQDVISGMALTNSRCTECRRK